MESISEQKIPLLHIKFHIILYSREMVPIHSEPSQEMLQGIVALLHE